MSRKRRDPRNARLRRDRIRRQRHLERKPEGPGNPDFGGPYGMERMLRRFEAFRDQHPGGEITVGPQEYAAVEEAKKDDPKWRAQELAYDAMQSDDPLEALELVDEALKLDPDCIDANALMVSRLPMSQENRIQLMREIVDKAERAMGERFFEENAGEFWHMLSTRPYMRAKQALGDLLALAGQIAEAAAIFERLLDLNPDDNQGVRSQLLALYLAANQPEGARGVLARYPDEDNWLATFHWGRVMERWLSGEFSGAETALARARENNPFVEEYVLGAKPVPAVEPRFFSPGEDSEAQICASELACALKAHPGFREWLRTAQR